MKPFILTFSFLLSFQALAMSPMLEPLAKSVDQCLSTEGILLCQDDLAAQVTKLDLNARGEFVYFLKGKMQPGNKTLVVNLYKQFKALIPIYEELDGDSEWSCRDAKEFVGDIAVEYVKVSDIDADFLIGLLKEQNVQSSRYNLLTTVHERAAKASTEKEINDVIRFAEFAKEYVRAKGDEYYLYESAFNLVKKMTDKLSVLNPVHEGIYSITFDDPEINRVIHVNTISVMQSNSGKGLIISMNDKNARLTKFVFEQAGMLGDTIFSNEDVFENQINFSGASVKFSLDRVTGEIKGTFNTARFGMATFTGKQVANFSAVYKKAHPVDLSLKKLVGKYAVKVGNISLTLTLRKRRASSSKIEAALYNNNVLISFSRVQLDQKRGILELIDTNNSRKILLNVEDNGDSIGLAGIFFNVVSNSVMRVTTK